MRKIIAVLFWLFFLLGKSPSFIMDNRSSIPPGKALGRLYAHWHGLRAAWERSVCCYFVAWIGMGSTRAIRLYIGYILVILDIIYMICDIKCEYVFDGLSAMYLYDIWWEHISDSRDMYVLSNTKWEHYRKSNYYCMCRIKHGNQQWHITSYYQQKYLGL